jgi:hypothetical protein
LTAEAKDVNQDLNALKNISTVEWTPCMYIIKNIDPSSKGKEAEKG